MKVSDLKNGTKVDDIELKVVSKEEPREFTSKYGSTGRFAMQQVRMKQGR